MCWNSLTDVVESSRRVADLSLVKQALEVEEVWHAAILELDWASAVLVSCYWASHELEDACETWDSAIRISAR